MKYLPCWQFLFLFCYLQAELGHWRGNHPLIPNSSPLTNSTWDARAWRWAPRAKKPCASACAMPWTGWWMYWPSGMLPALTRPLVRCTQAQKHAASLLLWYIKQVPYGGKNKQCPQLHVYYNPAAFCYFDENGGSREGGVPYISIGLWGSTLFRLLHNFNVDFLLINVRFCQEKQKITLFNTRGLL
jgi:hypothetical protein